MDLHLCIAKYMKSCFILCKHVTNHENGASRCYKVLKGGYIYVYFDNFWVVVSSGIHPLILSNINTMFSMYYEDRW